VNIDSWKCLRSFASVKISGCFSRRYSPAATRKSEQRDAACKAYLDSCGASWLDDLDPEQRHALLMQVRSGAADRFKAMNAAEAALA
jgi:hypothetical protein